MKIKTLSSKGLEEKNFEVNEAVTFLKEKLNAGMWVYVDHKSVKLLIL